MKKSHRLVRSIATGCLLPLFTPLFSPQLSAAGFEIVDASEFRKVVPEEAALKQLGGGMQFIEGPVWFDDQGGFLIFSDIPANELKKWTPSGGISTARKPSNKANGNTLDGKGRLVTAEHGERRVSLTDRDGNIITVTDSYQGKKFNSPNDVVVKSDGTFWFTDPDYGLENRTAEMDGNYVFRHDPKSGETTLVARGFDKPNGLCFSPNQKLLYVADSGAPRHVRVFDVEKDGTLTNNRVFYWVDKGAPDGIRCDYKGRLFITAGDGVHIVGRDGELIGKILMDETPANLCFGARKNRTLFVTARTSLYAIELKTRGDD